MFKMPNGSLRRVPHLAKLSAALKNEDWCNIVVGEICEKEKSWNPGSTRHFSSRKWFRFLRTSHLTSTSDCRWSRDSKAKQQSKKWALIADNHAYSGKVGTGLIANPSYFNHFSLSYCSHSLVLEVEKMFLFGEWRSRAFKCRSVSLSNACLGAAFWALLLFRDIIKPCDFDEDDRFEFELD